MSTRPPRPVRAPVVAIRTLVAAIVLILSVAVIGVPSAWADGPVPTTMAVVSGDGQTAPASTQFDDPLVVQVLDQDATPIEGTVVTFEVSGPAVFATGAELTVVTGSDGTAQTGALSTTAGTGAVEVTATAEGGTSPSATFHLTVTPPVARTLQIVSGNDQSTTFGYAFASPLTVEAVDESGRPVQPTGAAIDFTIQSDAYFLGGATDASVPVGPDGRATSPTILPGSTAGTVSVEAEIRDDNGSTGVVTFALTVEAPAPTSVQVFSGDGQTAQIGRTFSDPLTAQVLDQRTTRLASVAVTFAVTGPARFAGKTSATVETDAEGLAIAPALTALTSVAGAVDVVATAAGGSEPSTEFHLEVTSPAAASLVQVAGGGQVSFRQLQFAAPITVQALDANDAPVAPAGAVVEFAIVSGNATYDAPIEDPSALDRAGVPTDRAQQSGTLYGVPVASNGTATLPGQVIFPTLQPGQNGIVQLVATIHDGNGSQGTTTVLLYVSSDPPTSMSVSSGNGQTAAPGAVFGAPLVVNVLDENSFPVVGAPVVIDVTSGPALISEGAGYVAGGTQTTVVTDQNGNAAVNIVAGGTAGAVTIAASVSVQSGPSPTPVTFDLTVKTPTGGLGTPDPPTPPAPAKPADPGRPTGPAAVGATGPTVADGSQVAPTAGPAAGASGATAPRSGSTEAAGVGALARTGFGTGTLVVAGLALLALGAVLHLQARTRLRRATPARTTYLSTHPRPTTPEAQP